MLSVNFYCSLHWLLVVCVMSYILLSFLSFYYPLTPPTLHLHCSHLGSLSLHESLSHDKFPSKLGRKTFCSVIFHHNPQKWRQKSSMRSLWSCYSWIINLFCCLRTSHKVSFKSLVFMTENFEIHLTNSKFYK